MLVAVLKCFILLYKNHNIAWTSGFDDHYVQIRIIATPTKRKRSLNAFLLQMCILAITGVTHTYLTEWIM